MKLQSIVGLVALLFPLCIPAASANQQTDLQWKKYLGGRKIVQFSNYSSSFGGGGMSSQQELHFCSNGRFAYASQSSVAINAGGASGSSGGVNQSAGTWKIIESNPQLVLIEFVSSEGEKQRSLLGFGQDGRLYNDAGKRLLTTASNACR